MATVELLASQSAVQAVALDRSVSMVAAPTTLQPTAAIRNARQVIEPYFAEDYMVDNNDYACTVTWQ